ncbi:MAG: helix-turn-helix domain-containing protein, partial [Clostridia bacterium]|nr:helix-turn-helix domain-containing protein [Clostridia bacterium]
DWATTLARAESAFRELQIYGERGYLIRNRDCEFRIINLTLADKRLALENFLKESSLDQAYSLFEDIVDRLGKRARDLHWIQLRHELLKLCCALYNGGFHYQQSPQFFSSYSRTMEKLMHCSFDEAVHVMRNVLHSFDVQKYQEIIGVGLMDYAAAARELIEKHYASDLTLGGTARQFGITPEYLSAIFRKSVGRNFVEYLTDVRVEHACRLLTISGAKISEIAHMVGFGNPDYFGKVFKQKMHMTPRQYQKNKA